MKPRPNHRLYLKVLRSMTPAERLRKACELSDYTRRLAFHGLREQFPDRSERDLVRILLRHTL